MRIYKTLLLISALSASTAVQAAVVTPEQALARASSSKTMARGARQLAPRFVREAQSVNGTPTMYVFTYSGDNGFMVLPADDRAYPVLAYSETGSLDEGGMAPGAEWWLRYYADQIASLSPEVAPVADEGTTTYPAAVDPLVPSSWSQSPPYNLLCPKDKNGGGYMGTNSQAPTGCGATAMAQVMYYWKYPKTGKGRASYNSVFAGMELSLDFSSQVFDWDNMLDKYYPNAYTDEQANAVAELMRACGYSVKMHYAADQSEAEPEFFADAFINRFKYDGKTVKFVERRNRTQSELATTRDEWEKLIYGELAAGRPMVFAGYDEIRGLGGHIFVCDGYDGNGKFHFNFGWAGTSDGYFSMDAVTPRTMGGSVTGASTGQYSFRQTATVGVQPPAGTLTASALTLGGKKVDMTRDEFVFVKSLDDIEVKLTLEGKTGRVVSPISVKVYDMDTEEEICSQLVTDPVTISEGWTVSATGSFTVPFGGGDRIPYLVKFYYTVDDKETNFLEVEMALDEDAVIPDNPGNEDPGGDTPDNPGNEDPGADTPDNPGAENGIFAVDASGNRLHNVYSPLGILIKKSATQEQLLSLPAGIYIINGRKYIIK